MKLIRQTTFKDCGVACVAMLINHYFKFNIDIEQIKFQLDLNDEQLSFFDIADIAAFFKLSSEAFEVDLDFNELKTKTPFIAQINNSQGITHFVVVEKISQRSVHFFDPNATKKQILKISNFLNIFQNYVMLFKADKKSFRSEFAFNFSHLKTLLNYESLIYLWITFFNAILMILETRMIRVFSLTLNQEYQSFVFYVMFIIIFLIGFICTKSCGLLLNKAYEKRVKQKLSAFLKYTSKNNKNSLFTFYHQIIWVYKFEQFRIMNFVSSLITEVIALTYIAFISSKIFLIMFSFELVLFLIIYFKNNNFKHQDKNPDEKWLNYLANLKNIKNTSQELKVQNQLLNQNFNPKANNDFEFFIDLLIKCITLVIYYFSWNLIKNNEIDFNSFFIILILKSFNRSFIFNLNFILLNWKQYLSYKVKINQLLFNSSMKQKISLTSIESIILINSSSNKRWEFTTQAKRVNFDLPLSILNKTSKTHEWEIYINNISINQIDDANLRSHILYVDGSHIIFGTIHQNIITNGLNNKSSIFLNPIIKDLLEKHDIKLQKIIEPDNVKQIEREIIALLSIFFSNSKVVILNFSFELISSNCIDNITQLFNELFCDKFLILN